MARVYISVSNSRTDDADLFRETVLAPSLELPIEDFFLFRTSRKTNIPISADSRRSMALRACEADAFLFIVDPDFLGSAFCFMEVGAAWVRSAEIQSGGVHRSLSLDEGRADSLVSKQVVLVDGGVRKRQISPPTFPPLQAGDFGSEEDLVEAVHALAYLLDRRPVGDVGGRVASFRQIRPLPEADMPDSSADLGREAPMPGIVTPSLAYDEDGETAYLLLQNYGDTEVSNVRVDYVRLEGCDLGGAGVPPCPVVFGPHETHRIPVFRNARVGWICVRISCETSDGMKFDLGHELELEFR